MTSNSNHTGKALAEFISARGMSQSALASAANSSQPYVNQVVNGARTPSSDWLDMVAEVMELTKKERVRLHRAGAKDNGFKIDL